jgi:MoxR-like ATPase
MSKPPIIIYGPAGCGKTRNAERLRRLFGLGQVADLEHLPRKLKLDTLYLTNLPSEEIRRLAPNTERHDFRDLPFNAAPGHAWNLAQ